MSFCIDKVVVHDLYYNGTDEYSDGSIEDEYLEIARQPDFEKVLKKDNRWPILYHFSDIRENLLEWYPFSSDRELLEIGAGCGALTGLFCRKVRKVTSVELSMKRSVVNANRNHECSNLEILVGNYEEIEPNLGTYDYITLIGVWEYSVSYISGNNSYIRMLQLAKKHLSPDGKIFIAIENKMGIKYWNGAPEDHTGKQFDGLQNYINYNSVRTFSKPEIEEMLYQSGLRNYVFYYPMPDYKLPEVIYSDEMLPQPGMERNYRKDYAEPRQYIFNDAIIMDQIAADNVFPYFANSFLIVAGDSVHSIMYCKYNRQRKKKYRTKVEIKKNKAGDILVVKQPLNQEARKHVISLKEKETFCKDAGLMIKSPVGWIDDNNYITEYVAGITLQRKFYDNMDVDEIVKCITKIKMLLLNSITKTEFEPTPEFRGLFGDVYPSRAFSISSNNIDLSPSNIKLDNNGNMMCYDNEWVFNYPIPIDYVIWRMTIEFYCAYSAYIKNKIKLDEIFSKIGLEKKDVSCFECMEKGFATEVFGSSYSEMYLRKYVKPCISQNWKLQI